MKHGQEANYLLSLPIPMTNWQQLDNLNEELQMNINEAFPSSYLKADDLQGKRIKAKLDRVEQGDEQSTGGKPVLYFEGKEKGMVLNKTNAMALAGDFGPDTDTWKGKEVELYTIDTTFNGKNVKGLRVSKFQDYVPGEDDSWG